MAYGHSQIHGITNPPSIEAFSFALADMIGKDENAEVGMTSNGQLVRQVDVPERKTGWTNLGGWFGSGETFKDCQENLERYLDFHSQQKRLADRKITVVSTAPKMNLKTVGELFSQITVADNTPFKDDVPIYSNDALNGPFPEAARIRKGDVDELLRLLHEKSAIPLDFEDVKAAHRQSLLDLYKFDQEAVVDLRDLLQTRDMKDPYQKTVAMTQLGGLLNRFNKRSEAAATDHTPAVLPPKNIDPSTGMRDVSEPEPTRPRRRAELRESGGHSPKGASVVPERPGFEDRIAELSHQAEAISNVYQGARDAVALLNIIDEMWPIDANLAGQLLDYWVTRADFPVTKDQAYRFLQENRHLSTLLAEPPAKEALAGPQHQVRASQSAHAPERPVQRASQRIEKSQNIRDVLDHIQPDESVVVCFDLDDTLIAKDVLQGGHQGRVMVNRETEQILRGIRSRAGSDNARVILLTANDEDSLARKLTETKLDRRLFDDAITIKVQTGPLKTKGEGLKHYLDRSKFPAGHIVMVDDVQGMLESVEDASREKGIPFTTFHFYGAKPQGYRVDFANAQEQFPEIAFERFVVLQQQADDFGWTSEDMRAIYVNESATMRRNFDLEKTQREGWGGDVSEYKWRDFKLPKEYRSLNGQQHIGYKQ